MSKFKLWLGFFVIGLLLAIDHSGVPVGHSLSAASLHRCGLELPVSVERVETTVAAGAIYHLLAGGDLWVVTREAIVSGACTAPVTGRTGDDHFWSPDVPPSVAKRFERTILQSEIAAAGGKESYQQDLAARAAERPLPITPTSLAALEAAGLQLPPNYTVVFAEVRHVDV